MKKCWKSKFRAGLFPLCLAVLLCPPIKTTIGAPPAVRQKEEQIRGRIVFLEEELQKSYGAEVPATHDHLYGFKTKDGKFFTLVRTRTSEALFADKRLLEKDLILIGRTYPKSMTFDTFSIRSVHKDGKVFELYYYCDICSIKSVSPEECQCCRGPVRLVESPVGEFTDDLQ